jgi:tripartite-type tricarboxylate transporter receptor subunit TctC
MLRRPLLASALALPALRRADAALLPAEIRILVGFAAGGGTDLLARRLQPYFEERGHRLVVENLPGGGSAIAMARLAHARPDGGTLGLATSGLMSLIATGDMTQRPSDYTALVRVSEDPLFVAVYPSSPIRTPADLLARLRATGGGMTIGSAGTHGGTGHIALAGMAQAAGGNFVHVVYPGAARLVAELLGGHLEAGIFKPNDVLGHVRSGQLRPVVALSRARLVQMPDMPIFAEQGLDVFPFGDILQMSYVAAPARLPPELKAELVAMLREYVLSPQAQAIAANEGYIADGQADPELSAAIESTVANIRAVQPRLRTTG